MVGKERTKLCRIRDLEDFRRQHQGKPAALLEAGGRSHDKWHPDIGQTIGRQTLLAHDCHSQCAVRFGK